MWPVLLTVSVVVSATPSPLDLHSFCDGWTDVCDAMVLQFQVREYGWSGTEGQWYKGNRQREHQWIYGPVRQAVFLVYKPAVADLL
jgi:hypothetical protein